ncbi:leucyl aminopeptidase [Bogoriella caseilytica]|uniref:Probable cytosol aminopeptidase n=1 Tax=Bogoriella caseilytica TaxID=56055 RepID=A0A3N2B9C3_9MICO|nr:leucyl aminopeptidase [Bogoriella caseilytica]ROR71798.1 leucyl aminopeptidase [Bogoriella caseilytica]
MTNIALTTKNPATVDADALVVAVAKSTGKTTEPQLIAPEVPPKALKGIAASLSALGATGSVGEVLKVPAGEGISATVLVLTGIGTLDDAEAPETESLRRAAGSAARALAGTVSAVLALPAADPVAVAAISEGALMGAYAYRTYRSESTEPVRELTLAVAGARQKETKEAFEAAVIVAEAVAGARDLVNAPPRDLYPETFADAAKAAAKGTKVSVNVLDEKALAAGGYGGLLGVGQGSSRPPRLVKISYSPARAKKHYALVGKGITFDSGGLSLKPGKGMETMKLDMAGAATVLHAVLAVAKQGLPIKVTGWLALAENMPSGTAQRPSDVITIRGGKTVEVLNTDAEGRLVMADALVAAVEESPDAVLDIATLTGAQVVALGSKVGGVMGDEGLRSDVVAAAERVGEQFWPMPLPAEMRSGLDSPVADLANISANREGGMLTAGLFLQEFVGSTPWAHLDVAGPAFHEGSPEGYTVKGGTGMGLRTLVGLLAAASVKTA